MLTMDQLTIYNVNGVAGSDKLTVNYHQTLHSPSIELFFILF